MKENIGQLDKYYGDLFLFLVLGISFFGAIMIFSTTAPQNAGPYLFFKKQVIFIFIGLVMCCLVEKVKFQNYKKITEILLAVNVLLLVYVLFFSSEIKGAHRWIKVPFFGNFQPSELTKITVVLFVAKFLDRYRSKIVSFKREVLVLLGVVFFICAIIIIQPDIGIPIVIFSTTISLLFISGVKLDVVSKVIFIMLLILAISTILAPHRIKRIMTFLDPWKYHNAEGYQLVQSYLALSYGHLLGRGLGKSQFKEFYLPEAHTDFIFSVIGEELGFVGSVGVIVAFVIFFFLVTKMAEGTESFYGSILIYGMALNIVLQAFVNVAVVCGLLPTKGLGLPFISYGGSSLITNFISVGIILGVWKQSVKKF